MSQSTNGGEKRHRGCSTGGGRIAVSLFTELCHDRANHACPEGSCKNGNQTASLGTIQVTGNRASFSAARVLGRSLDVRVLAVLLRHNGGDEPGRGHSELGSVP